MNQRIDDTLTSKRRLLEKVRFLEESTVTLLDQLLNTLSQSLDVFDSKHSFEEVEDKMTHILLKISDHKDTSRHSKMMKQPSHQTARIGGQWSKSQMSARNMMKKDPSEMMNRRPTIHIREFKEDIE